jgi:hypothetical protein
MPLKKNLLDNRVDELERSSNPLHMEMDPSHDKDKKNIWDSMMPLEFCQFQILLRSSAVSKIVYRTYLCFAVILFAYYISEIYLVAVDKDTTRSHIPFYALNMAQNLLYTCLPFSTEIFFRQVIGSRASGALFARAAAIDPVLPTRISTLTHFNILCMVVAVVTYGCIVNEPVITRVLAVVLSSMFLLPFSLSYSLSVALVEAHRVHAAGFCLHVKTTRSALEDVVCERSTCYGSAGDTDDVQAVSCENETCGKSLSELRLQYRTLHASCLRTSEVAGRYILLMFLCCVLFAVTTILNVYVHDQTFDSSAAFIFLSLLMLLELGLAVVFANEQGNIVCRELATLCLLHEEYFTSPQDTGQAMLLLECMGHCKLEVLFFGNFALRSRHLTAILATFVGAVFPIILGEH